MRIRIRWVSNSCKGVPFHPLLKNCETRESQAPQRWLITDGHLLLQRTLVRFPTPTRQFTTRSDSSSHVSSSGPRKEPGTYPYTHTCKIKKKKCLSLSWVLWCIPLISASRRQRQLNFCEFKASQGYKKVSRTTEQTLV